MKSNLILDKNYIVGYSKPSRGAGVTGLFTELSDQIAGGRVIGAETGHWQPSSDAARLAAGWTKRSNHTLFPQGWWWPGHPNDAAAGTGGVNFESAKIRDGLESVYVVDEVEITDPGGRDTAWGAWKPYTGRAPNGGWYGHPCLPAQGQLSHSPKADFLRLALGNYWAFEEGIGPPTFNNFGYLIKRSDQHGGTGLAINVANFIPYKIVADYPGIPHTFEPAPTSAEIADLRASDPGKLYNLLGKKYGLSLGMAGFGTSKGDSPWLARVTTLNVQPGEPAWLAGSAHASLFAGVGSNPGDPLYPFTANTCGDPVSRRLYITGDKNYVTHPPSPAPEKEHFPGILGRFNSYNEPGTLKRVYYDHAHEIFTPYLAGSPAANNTSLPVKIASISSAYYYAVAKYDAAINDDGIDERELPNTYILQQAIDHNPANLESSPPAPTAPQRAEPFLNLIGQFRQLIVDVADLLPHFNGLNSSLDSLETQQAGSAYAIILRTQLVTQLNDIYQLYVGIKPGEPSQIPGAVELSRDVMLFFEQYGGAALAHGAPTPPTPPAPPWYDHPHPPTAPDGAANVGSAEYDEWVMEKIVDAGAERLWAVYGDVRFRNIDLDTLTAAEVSLALQQAALDAQAPQQYEISVAELMDASQGWARHALDGRQEDIDRFGPAVNQLVYDVLDAYINWFGTRLAAAGIMNDPNVTNIDAAAFADWETSTRTNIAELEEQEAEFQVDYSAFTADLQAWNDMVQALVAANNKLLSTGLYTLYASLCCSGDTDFMPTNYAQLYKLPYSLPGRASNRARTNYFQKFIGASHAASADQKAAIRRRNSHIGFSEKFMGAPNWPLSEMRAANIRQVKGKNEPPEAAALPYHLEIKFSTRLGGAVAAGTEDNDPDDFMRVLRGQAPIAPSSWIVTVPGAIDFLLHHIMLANIAEGHDFLGPYASADRAYKTNYEFSAKINDVDNGEIYYGFEWAEDAYTGTGFGGDVGLIDTYGYQGNRRPNDPIYSAGSYDLKTIELPLALTYVGILPTDAGSDPNPQVGQFSADDTCLAFGEGLFVGNRDINIGSAVGAANSQIYTEAEGAGKLVINNVEFNKLILRLSQLIERSQRTFGEILDGKLAYSEAIAYKVEKYRVDKRTGQIQGDVIQSFYFPNIPAMQEITYLDTQVKYGQQYAYKVYVYTLVIGAAYNYNNSTQAGTTPAGGGISAPPWKGALARVNQWPSVQIIEEPYVTLGPAMVADLPPPMPEVEVVPFKGVNNRIRFLIQRQEGSYMINPDNFIINAEDAAKYNELRVAQSVAPGDPILFEVDNIESVTFEIYRIDTKPSSYRDFEGALLAMPDAITPSGREATEYTYDDTSILPNKKYYYTFRSADPHGNLSTATPIYEVEIVDDNGRIYPVVNIVSLSPCDPQTTTTKPLRRFLQIDAAFPQQAVDTTSIDTTDQRPAAPPPSPILDTQIEGIWTPSTPTAVENTPLTDEKVFKIRVTSKQTGKKLDLNVRFIENPIANPHEQD